MCREGGKLCILVHLPTLDNCVCFLYRIYTCISRPMYKSIPQLWAKKMAFFNGPCTSRMHYLQKEKQYWTQKLKLKSIWLHLFIIFYQVSCHDKANASHLFNALCQAFLSLRPLKKSYFFEGMAFNFSMLFLHSRTNFSLTPNCLPLAELLEVSANLTTLNLNFVENFLLSQFIILTYWKHVRPCTLLKLTNLFQFSD